MPEHLSGLQHPPAEIDAGVALRALPLLAPPHSAWPELRKSLPPPRRSPPGWRWLALAAAVGIAALLPTWLAPTSIDDTVVPMHAGVEQDDATQLQALMIESAQLEALISWNGDGSVDSAAAASLSVAARDRIGELDALLASGDVTPAAVLPLWQERVLRLRELADLGTTRQLLAANGDADIGTPILML